MMPTSQLPKVPFYFLRHGRTKWNAECRYMGNQDIPLDHIGIMQANIARDFIERESIAHIVCSPMARALETAQIINKNINLPITVLDGLRERSFGDVEGYFYGDDVCTLLKDSQEDYKTFAARVLHDTTQALQTAHTLIISHSGVYKCICNAMKWPYIHLDNCELVLHQNPVDSSQPWSIYYLSHARE